MKPSDPLDPLLRSWNPEAPTEEGFRQAVWSRIASQAEEAGNVTRRGFGFRPVAMAAAAAVVLGFSLGFLIPGAAPEAAHEAYFERINPLAEVQ